MTFNQFCLLDERQRIKTFWRDGVLVGQRFEDQSLVECRQIEDFYVEYKILERNFADIRAFKNPDLLEPYLSKIDIRHVLK